MISVCLFGLRDFCSAWGVGLLPLGGCLGGLVFVSVGSLGLPPALGCLLPLCVVGALGLLPALLRFYSNLVAVMGICPLVPVPCWFRLLGLSRSPVFVFL